MDESMSIIFRLVDANKKDFTLELNQSELQHLKRWLNAITGKTAMIGDLQKYITENKITNKRRLLNKLHADFVNLPE